MKIVVMIIKDKLVIAIKLDKKSKQSAMYSNNSEVGNSVIQENGILQE